MDLSIIIVNYKTEELTRQCLQSVYACDLKGWTYEVILVDNASGDGSAQAAGQAFPQTRLILNDANLGFSKANNIGMAAASGDYLLLLNSDTVVEADTFYRSLRYMKANPEIGALGCKVLLPDGRLDVACKRSFPTPLNSLCHMSRLDRVFPQNPVVGAYNLTFLDPDKIYSVDCLVGAYMMVSRDVIELVGTLDEDYFMYGEDIDWCYRIKEAGYLVVYYPKVSITHYKKASGLGRKNPQTIEAFYDAMKIFYGKHYQDKYDGLTARMVLGGTQVLKKIALLRNR